MRILPTREDLPFVFFLFPSVLNLFVCIFHSLLFKLAKIINRKKGIPPTFFPPVLPLSRIDYFDYKKKLILFPQDEEAIMKKKEKYRYEENTEVGEENDNEDEERDQVAEEGDQVAEEEEGDADQYAQSVELKGGEKISDDQARVDSDEENSRNTLIFDIS